MKILQKYPLKNTETFLETDIDDSQSLYTPWTHPERPIKKKYKRRVFKKNHQALLHTVTINSLRRSFDSNSNICQKLWEFPAMKNNSWICLFASRKNSRKWYFLFYSGSRQRYWVRWGPCWGRSREMLWLAEIGNSIKQRLFIFDELKFWNPWLCILFSHSITESS